MDSPRDSSVIRILLVTPERAACEIFDRVCEPLRNRSLKCALVETTAEATELLDVERQPRFELPYLILVDGATEGGLSFLGRLKSHPRFRYVPTVVFASDDAEIARAYDLGANCVLDRGALGWVAALEGVASFWFHHATLPGCHGPVTPLPSSQRFAWSQGPGDRERQTEMPRIIFWDL